MFRGDRSLNLSYAMQYSPLEEKFNKLGINSSHLVHFQRIKGVEKCDKKGVDLLDIARGGNFI